MSGAGADFPHGHYACSRCRHTHRNDSRIGIAHAAYGSPVRGFTDYSIAEHIEQATEKLRELVGEQTLTPNTWRTIEPAVRDLVETAKRAALDAEDGTP